MKSFTFTFLLTWSVWSEYVARGEARGRQKRAWIIESFEIEEEHPGPFPYLLGHIELDRQYLVHLKLHGSGVDEDPKNLLSIDRNTGMISVNKKIDFEEYKILKLRFEAVNVSNNEVDTKLGLEVKILDINDHSPEFEPPNYTTTIAESDVQGQNPITMAISDRDAKGPNSTFSVRMVSVTPITPNAEFYLSQGSSATSILFRGCLDYEQAENYTIVLEAKDHGEKVQLSSTSTVVLNLIDQNNHLPQISGQTGPGRVKEGETGVTVLRLQVTDKDSPGSKAWKVKFTIHNNEDKYFRIETDPETNEGILTVANPINYEDFTIKNLSISVENEEPYFSCEVKSRSKQGEWEVKHTYGSEAENLGRAKRYDISIIVEDVNDPPVFSPPLIVVGLPENSQVGTSVETLTAVDSDGKFANTFRYLIADDPAAWLSVDPDSGVVTTTQVLDRESPFVKGNDYTVTVHAVDNGEPQMTGTGTLVIHLSDQNDNAPVLKVDALDMCLSDHASMANITALDPDLPPYSGPFHFELVGDVKGRWRLEPSYGTTVNLVKEKTVYAGHHKLAIKILDSQGHSSLQSLSITVCACSAPPSCRGHRAPLAQIGSNAIGIILLAVLLLFVILLLAMLVSCKTVKAMMPADDGPGWHLLKSNIETPGTDCKVSAAFHQANANSLRRTTSHLSKTDGVIQKQDVAYQSSKPVFAVQQNGTQSSMHVYQQSMHRNSLHRSSTRRSNSSMSHYQGSMRQNRSTYKNDAYHLRGEILSKRVGQRLHALHAPGVELGDYEPYPYAYEGEPVDHALLDPLCASEEEFSPDSLGDLDNRFSHLASICRPDLYLQMDM